MLFNFLLGDDRAACSKGRFQKQWKRWLGSQSELGVPSRSATSGEVMEPAGCPLSPRYAAPGGHAPVWWGGSHDDFGQVATSWVVFLVCGEERGPHSMSGVSAWCPHLNEVPEGLAGGF